MHLGGLPPLSLPGAVEFRLLGTLSVRVESGREVGSVLVQPKRFALLAYLATATPRGFHRRDTLLALLWPEADQEHARGSLRKAVHFLRQQLGPELIVSRGEEEIGLAPGRCWCDAVAFDEAMEAGRFDRATELYKGDVLPGLHLSDMPEFERWLESIRSQVRDRAARAGWSLADAEADKGHPADAVRWARWAFERSPYDENGLRRLLARLVEAGDRAGAVLAYEQFAQRLSVDLELLPSAETIALVETLRRGRPAASIQDPRTTTRFVASELTPSEASAAGPRRPGEFAGLRLSLLPLVAVSLIGGLGLSLKSSAAAPEVAGLAHRERLLVADFGSLTNDTSLGSVVTDAFRIDLTQSPNVSVVSPTHVTEMLGAMRLPGTTRLTPDVARELALRDGIKAVVAGEIATPAASICSPCRWLRRARGR